MAPTFSGPPWVTTATCGSRAAATCRNVPQLICLIQNHPRPLNGVQRRVGEIQLGPFEGLLSWENHGMPWITPAGICWGPWGILEDLFNQNGWLMNAVHSHCRLRLASLDVWLRLWDKLTMPVCHSYTSIHSAIHQSIIDLQ